MDAAASKTTAVSMASQKAERLRIEMDVFKFILRLRIVTVDHLALDNRKCTLCKKPYGRSFQVQGPEMACELPCGCTVGHMCIREYWSLFEMAQVSCPVCQKQIPKLVEAATALTRLQPLFARSEPSYNTHRCPPDPRIGVIEEEDMRKETEQFENDTGLHFLSHDGSHKSSVFEEVSADLCNWSEDATSEQILTDADQIEKVSKEVENVERGSSPASGEISSAEGKSRKGSNSRVLGLGRAAVKAVDIFPKKSG
ncbi:hypothetical protein N7G274_007105 [Stereocaulon virgatum]|uniref:RING-type domain-containing protein n=1 Tax=Stereocaulon virgatum TaxID=373712 RepID=A0ABR4A730_9LECA